LAASVWRFFLASQKKVLVSGDHPKMSARESLKASFEMP
jgi:hypothetical protein